MRHFSKLTQKLYRKWYKWLLLPFPYLFFVSLFGFSVLVQFGLYAMISVQGFESGETEIGKIITIVTSIFVTVIWALALIIASAKGRRRDLKYVIGFPACVLFISFVVYLGFYSLDFIVDFVAYLFMLIVPVVCIYAIFVLLIYKLIRVLFIPAHASTQNFAEPVMHTEPQPADQPE